MNILHVLTLIFVFAKLFEVINWSWWLVLAPSIVSFALAMIVIVMGLILVYFGAK